MPTGIDPSRGLLFGLLALQNGLIDQDQLVGAFRVWSRDSTRSLADRLIDRGDLDAEQRALIDGLVAQHLKKHGGSAERSLATLDVDRIRQDLAHIDGPLIEATLGHIPMRAPVDTSRATNVDPDRTGTYSVGSATSDGQRFRILRPHARGGLGAVFVALDSELNREVALKQILDSHADDTTSRVRFLLEAEVTGGLEHPGIVPVYGLGTYDGGRPYYAMRFIRGDTLKEAIERFHSQDLPKKAPGLRSLELRRMLRRFTDVCNAIDYAHSRGILHRDIKPSNVIVGQHGETLVVDWGLAKPMGRREPACDSGERPLVPHSASGSAETLPGSALGTPAYMSPEQAEGDLEKLGPPSDVYSLGATLYCLLTGKPPFEGEVAEVLRGVQRGSFPTPRQRDPTIDPALEAVCLKAMDIMPSDRYATARALADDLERWMADEPVAARPEPWKARARRWMVRHRTGVAAGVAALTVAVVGLIGALALQARANNDLRDALLRESSARADAAEQSKQAEEAILSFHNRISADAMLSRPELAQLRRQLLGSALEFYEKRVSYLTGKSKDVGWDISKVAFGLDRIASLQALTGDRDSAIRTRRRIVELYDTNRKLVPENETAGALFALGELERLMGRADDAERTLREALKRYEEIRYHLNVSAVEVSLGRLLFDMGKAGEARVLLERARATQERDVAAGSPRIDLSDTYTTLANLHVAEGRPQEALSCYEKAEAIHEKNVALNPRYSRSELARALNNLGLSRAVNGQPSEGEREVERGKEIRERLLAEQPVNLDYRADLARSYYHLARIHVLANAADKAKADIRKAQELYSTIPPKGPEDIYFQACMKALHAGLQTAGKADSELSSAARANRDREAGEAVTLLKQAVAGGYSNPSRYRSDAPLNSLRARPDFQELLKSLGRP